MMLLLLVALLFVRLLFIIIIIIIIYYLLLLLLLFINRFTDFVPPVYLLAHKSSALATRLRREDESR